VVAAAREEWFSRVRGDRSFPNAAIGSCLESSGVEPRDVDVVTYAASEGRGAGLQSWLAPLARRPGRVALARSAPAEARHVQTGLQQAGIAADVSVVADFQAWASTAFLTSPFEEAAILVLNGPDADPACAFGRGQGSRVVPLAQVDQPHTVGTVYAALAHRMGMVEPWHEDELVDLAPLGRSRFAEQMRRELVSFDSDGFCRIRPAMLDGERLNSLYGRVYAMVGERHPGGERTLRDMDLARSAQALAEEAALHAARHLHRATGLPRLVLAGELALNPDVLGCLAREGPFEHVWAAPSPVDTSVGCALHLWHEVLRHPRQEPRTDGACYAGPDFTDAALRSYLEEGKIEHATLQSERLCEAVAELLARGSVVAWFQGPMAAGLHGLGARAILADPRVEHLRGFVNEKVKGRAFYRTCAASVLAEHADEYFKGGSRAPMLAGLPLSREHARSLRRSEKRLRGLERLAVERSDIPAVTRADRTAYVHVVRREAEPLFHRLLELFHARTGCPVLLNASFCSEDQPVVASPHDAYATFMHGELPYLALGPFLLDKRQQPLWEEMAEQV
jgi:carbamoyltransferase